MPALLELARPTAGDLRALLLRRQPPDLERASRLIVDSGRVDEVIEVAREYADRAAASIAHVPGATSLSRFPPSYVDWALEEFRCGVSRWSTEPVDPPFRPRSAPDSGPSSWLIRVHMVPARP